MILLPDDDGPYYWHIKSGTIQRDPPPPPSPNTVSKNHAKQSTAGSDKHTDLRESAHLLSEFEGHALKYASQSLKTL